ncbi:MAG: hypothetical protein F6J94_28240 [Moorea sp. SIO1F2]|uniref:hypothetical protein n=1 Tax=Moorena sp. SIO1F2 TaxID=2607819 RepID=UPI0013BDE298|nr:hypothetical protein [Moorena sp. SIO1F2]NET85642.1 hypothetical protein [Moorena sp. SIO1F2]
MSTSQMPKQSTLRKEINYLVDSSSFSSAEQPVKLVNGGFEEGLKGWQKLGPGGIKRASFGITPTDGEKQLLLRTSNKEVTRTGQPKAPSASKLEEFLYLSTGTLDCIAQKILDTVGICGTSSKVVRGAAIQQIITPGLGDSLTFDWNFLTNEDVGDQAIVADFAFVCLSSPKSQIVYELANPILGVFSQAPNNFYNQTGFKAFTHTFTTAGTYSLGFGVVNELSNQTQSGLIIDNVQLTSPTVDDPASVLSLLSVASFKEA